MNRNKLFQNLLSKKQRNFRRSRRILLPQPASLTNLKGFGERRRLIAFGLETSRRRNIFALLPNAPLAQLAEQVTLNHWVVGSIPTRCKCLVINELQL